jgi:hypothetical protein
MAWRIDNINAMIIKLSIHTFPKARRCSRCNSNTSLLLLLHPIHCRGTIMYLTNFMRHAGIEKHSLSSSSLASINMSTDSYVSVSANGSFSRHYIFLLFKTQKGDYDSHLFVRFCQKSIKN